MFFIWSVLIERAHFYIYLAERGRTIRYGVLVDEGALTEGVRYIGKTWNQMNIRISYKSIHFLAKLILLYELLLSITN